MFFDCGISLATLTGIARWNVSTVVDFSNMFAQALNDRGQVVGTGLVDASAIKNWKLRFGRHARGHVPQLRQSHYR